VRSRSAFSVALSMLLSCHPGPRKETGPVPTPNTARLDERLDRSGYRRLFGLPDSRRRLDDLWGEPGTSEGLLDLAADPSASWHARFLASEVIFHEQMFLILHRPELFASLADVYARALAENASGFMSDWGFASSMDDPGVLGVRFVVFGLDADHALQRLLDETKEVSYVYPPELPFRARPGLRVEDFAALHLGRIHGIPLGLTEDPAQRDAEIRRLKSLLPRGTTNP
jgi:hypothetical protein